MKLRFVIDVEVLDEEASQQNIAGLVSDTVNDLEAADIVVSAKVAVIDKTSKL